MKRAAVALLGTLGALALAISAASCGTNSNDGPSSCVPGRTVQCTCTDGGKGLQSCLPDGNGYEACSFCSTPPNIGIEAGFKDVTGDVLGLDKSVGPCLGFEDFDGDGDFDILLSKQNDNPQGFAPQVLVVYPNLGGGKFASSAPIKIMEGMSVLCTAADFDRDGLPDIIAQTDKSSEHPVLAYFHNKGGLQFEQDTTAFDINPLDDHMVLAMGHFDQDNDGWLDVVVGRSHGGGPSSSDACKMLDNDFVCESMPYSGTSGPVVYRNDHGKFKLVPFLLSGPFPGTTNALAFADLDGNSLPDVIMANDWFSNHVHLQTSVGKFQRSEVPLGIAQFNHGMGLAVNDFDLDGHPDLYATDLGPNNLWFSDAKGVFKNLNKETGISKVTRYHSNWAAIAEDFNLNGFPDIFVGSSGVVTNDEDMVKMAMVINAPINDLVPQFDLVFWNRGGRQFAPITLPHRGKQNPYVIFGSSAAADYDNDGDIDILVSTGDGLQLRLLENQQPPGNYLTVELVGKKANPHGVGAMIELMKSGVSSQRRYVGTGGSLGSSWHRAHFGLGAATSVDGLRIHWPGGHLQVVSNIDINRTIQVVED